MLLSNEDVGVYIKLMCGLWISGNSLPFDLDKLAIVAMTTGEAMHRIWPNIEDKFVIDSGIVKHARFEKMIDLADIRRKAGTKGGRPKQMESKTKANGKQTQKQSVSNLPKNEERRTKT